MLQPVGFERAIPPGPVAGRKPASSAARNSSTARRTLPAASVCALLRELPVLDDPAVRLLPSGIACHPLGKEKGHCRLDWRTSLACNLLIRHQKSLGPSLCVG